MPKNGVFNAPYNSEHQSSSLRLQKNPAYNNKTVTYDPEAAWKNVLNNFKSNIKTE